MCSGWKLNNFLPPLVKMCPASSKENVCTKKYSYRKLASLPSEYETRTICHIEKWVDLLWNHISFDSLGWCKHTFMRFLCGPSLLLCAIMDSSLQKDVMFLNLSEYLPKQSTSCCSVKKRVWKCLKSECISILCVFKPAHMAIHYFLVPPALVAGIQNLLYHCGIA